MLCKKFTKLPYSKPASTARETRGRGCRKSGNNSTVCLECANTMLCSMQCKKNCSDEVMHIRITRVVLRIL